MNLKFRGKTAMVAASSRGLGYGIARVLAYEGANVAVASRSEERIRAVARELSDGSGSEVEGFVFDARDGQSVIGWKNAVLEHFGSVDCLVVNAGGPPPGRFDSFDDREWQEAFELTLLSSVRMIRSVLPCMRQRGSGSIVVVTSTSIKEPIDNLLLSTVMRAGVAGLIKSLSKELASDGIRINNLVPGRFDTERVKELDTENAKKSGVSAEEQRAKMESMVPVGRYGTPEEFGRAAAFLLSDVCSYVTGETFIIDGGATRTVW